jgi:hypothetical protein
MATSPIRSVACTPISSCAKSQGTRFRGALMRDVAGRRDTGPFAGSRDLNWLGFRAASSAAVAASDRFRSRRSWKYPGFPASHLDCASRFRRRRHSVLVQETCHLATRLSGVNQCPQ